jgi:hypothetical protein
MTLHGRGGLSAVVLGSVTNKVLTHTKTPERGRQLTPQRKMTCTRKALRTTWQKNHTAVMLSFVGD